ncbi:MAG: formyltransferase family protein, partial [Acidobacteria bacterium]|nr:formyltransferase family protein [Acidobacteriota bacterium]
MAVLNVAVLVSGRGSNLQALLDRAVSRAAFRVAVVVSDQPDAPALERAAAAGVPAAVVAPAAGERRGAV